MKKYYITLSALMAFLSFYAQNTDTSVDKAVLKQALIYADSEIAVNSMYNIIAKEGENSTYKDSLAYLYFNSRKYSSCFMVCSDILMKDSNKQDILEMQAISLENLMALEKAAQVYAKLVTKSNNNYHAYKLANIYYVLKNYDQALMAVKKAEELKDTGEIKVSYAINKNYSQQVALTSAIAFTRGLIEAAQEKNDAAISSFQKAVNIQSDFALAKDNLEALKTGKEVKKE
jgi:tetratricopeptide (TPR) repeat protein